MTAGISIATAKVLPEWIDVNGHMNVAYYVLAFDIEIGRASCRERV